MTNGNTNEEWLNLIEKAEKGVPTRFCEYKAPGLGTPEFAACIDHTLLKLDATKHEIEELCEQARTFKFKVSRDHIFVPWALPISFLSGGFLVSWPVSRL